MTYFRMPVFCWTSLASSMLIVAAFPILTATFVMLLLDRYVGMFLHQRRRRQHHAVRQFVLDLGPSRGLHPDPAGVRRLFRGHRHPFPKVRCSATARWCRRRWRSACSRSACGCITFSRWAPAPTSTSFGIMSMIIAVPTGVKIFNRCSRCSAAASGSATPVLYAIGFMVTLAIGGMTGLLAVPPVDFVVHNTVFLVAVHFHNVIIGGLVFGMFAAYNYCSLAPSALRCIDTAPASGAGRSALPRLHAAYGPASWGCRAACSTSPTQAGSRSCWSPSWARW